ncbi:hypothetical protein Tco_0558301 [Tanacetum coccineum]
MFNTNINQQQSGNSQQQSEAETQQEEEDETIPTPSSKKPGSRGKRVKKMAQKNVDPEPQAETVKVRTFWSQEEELLLAECFIQISEDPRIGSDKKNDTFWYKILDAYNDQAGKRGFPIRTKNMKVLQISTDGMNPIDAAIINAQKDRIRALYGPDN